MQSDSQAGKVQRQLVQLQAALHIEADECAVSLQQRRARALQALGNRNNERTSENALDASACLPECFVPI